jgi:S-(hydroxymethyl)glutathione dehydrogenase/alcohol dehydrogenase
MRGIVWTGSVDVTADLEVCDPGPTEVLVRVVSAGVCHSDLSVVDGTIQFPTPTVMGHEGAGIVEAVGSAVSLVAPGDHVVITTLEYCGACAMCDTGRPTMCLNQTNRIVTHKPFTYKGTPALAFANSGVFSEYVVIRENQAVKIDPNVSLDVAALLACGVITGAGAVFNRAKVERGSTVAVFGAGGVGLSALQAASLSGAARVISIDILPHKRELALQFGATDFIDASTNDAVSAVRDIAPGGVDYSLECVGFPKLIDQAIEMLAPGGTCVIVGTNPPGSTITVEPRVLNLDKTIMGCRAGTQRPHRDIPMFVDLYKTGRFKLDELVTQRYPLEEIETVFTDMKAGKLARGVLAISAG